MTETTGTATYLPPQDHDPSGQSEKMKSAGKPMPGVEVKIVDDEGHELGPRQVGEICLKSAANMSGYWNLPEATAKTLVDGFVHTGDAGYVDEDGYVYVHDRVKDMIVSGAENVYPAEVENAIFGHEAVADVAVIGVPDEKWGEAVKAVVVLKPGTDASADDIIGFARERIAGFKCPKSVDFIEELPRNPSGKILKRELRDPYWKGYDRRVN
jgi:acyl-CoA synthetase (AMP-forming)/AMP-acid ligase II